MGSLSDLGITGIITVVWGGCIYFYYASNISRSPEDTAMLSYVLTHVGAPVKL